jgi:hypothetical protein
MVNFGASADDTVVVGMYTSRSDAEVAKARLADYGIDALIVADNTHLSFQLTEGVRLRVFEDEAEEAREILAQTSESSGQSSSANLTGLEEDATVEGVSNGVDRVGEDNLTLASGSWIEATAWTYVAAFLLMVAIILTGLLVAL